MIRLRMKTFNTILTEKLQKCLLGHQVKLISMNILRVKKYYHLIKKIIIILEQAKFTYSVLGKAFETQIERIEDQGKKQIKVIQNQGEIKTIKKHAHSDKDEKFNEFDNGFSIFDKIRDGKRSLADAKNDQAEF